MPLVKTSGACSSAAKKLGGAVGKAKNYIGENKVKAELVGAAGVGTLGVGYAKRSKERAREEALVQNILERNLQKEAALFMPFLKALGGGVKSMASGIAGGMKAGATGMAKGFENAGFKNVANGINTAVSDIGKAGNWAMQRGRQLGGFVGNQAKQFGQWAGNTNIGQRAIGMGRNVASRVKSWFGPAAAASN